MEETKGEVDSLYCDPSIALLPLAGNTHVVQRQMFKFLESPWREHKPREDRVYEKDDGKCDTSGHTE